MDRPDSTSPDPVRQSRRDLTRFATSRPAASRDAASFHLSVGRLVSTSLGIYFRNLIPFLFLGTLVMGPWIALQFWLPGAQLERTTAMSLAFGAMLLQWVLAMMLTGAIAYGVAMQMRGRPASLGDCIGKGIGVFAGVLGTSILCSLRIFVMSLLLVVPGIIEMVRLYVAVPVAVMEGKAGDRAVRRSIELVRGSGWPLFGAWLLVTMLSAFLGMAVMFVAIIVNPQLIDGQPSAAAKQWFSVGITVPMQTFSASMMAVAYMQLRQGKENIDAKEIAKVFD